MTNSAQDSLQSGLGQLFRACIHYEMRAAVDSHGDLRSTVLLNRIEHTLKSIPSEYRPIVVYQLRWVRECYPFAPPITCEANQILGRQRLFKSISAGLDVVSDDARERVLWAAEVEGAFLRAKTLERMRDTALDYPILLHEAVQGGIDATIEFDLSEPVRRECTGRLRWLQQLRQEIEKQPIESWWRSILDADELRQVSR